MPDKDPSPALLQNNLLQGVLDWQNAFAGLWLQAQQNQLQILAAAQRAVEEGQRDLWDRWVCRFGGGVPLDG